MIAALKGYRMKLLMPDNMSQERRAAMRAYGAELILVTKEQGMEGARDLALEMANRGEGMITLAGDIGIFQHHHFTPGEQGGKKQYHDKAEINDMTRPQAACEFFQPALVFHFCLVLHPDDSQPAFL